MTRDWFQLVAIATVLGGSLTLPAVVSARSMATGGDTVTVSSGAEPNPPTWPASVGTHVQPSLLNKNRIAVSFHARAISPINQSTYDDEMYETVDNNSTCTLHWHVRAIHLWSLFAAA